MEGTVKVGAVQCVVVTRVAPRSVEHDERTRVIDYTQQA
jgi:hypothetical protein